MSGMTNTSFKSLAVVAVDIDTKQFFFYVSIAAQLVCQ